MKASLTSSASSPISGYWPTSARWTASVLISSMVRSACCSEKAGMLSVRSKASDMAHDAVNLAEHW
ncbi:MAG: DUF3017 domain-containing protein [Acidobacteriia bacterium]|nr:DUF3017 domain-containing protein [Terriglobia bacterium]